MWLTTDSTVVDGRYGLTTDSDTNWAFTGFTGAAGLLSVDYNIDSYIQILKENMDYQLQREQLLNDKIDLTQYLVWFLENYPNSVKVVQKNPDYQNRFN